MPESNMPVKSVEDVKALFSDYLRDHFNFIEEKGYVVLKPKQFLGSENFAKSVAIVRNAGGEYISAGKESHFKIPLAAEKPKEIPSSYDEVHQMVMDLRNYVEKSTEGILKKLGDLKPKKSNSDKG